MPSGANTHPKSSATNSDGSAAKAARDSPTVSTECPAVSAIRRERSPLRGLRSRRFGLHLPSELVGEAEVHRSEPVPYLAENGEPLREIVTGTHVECEFETAHCRSRRSEARGKRTVIVGHGDVVAEEQAKVGIQPVDELVVQRTAHAKNEVVEIPPRIKVIECAVFGSGVTDIGTESHYAAAVVEQVSCHGVFAGERYGRHLLGITVVIHHVAQPDTEVEYHIALREHITVAERLLLGIRCAAHHAQGEQK